MEGLELQLFVVSKQNDESLCLCLLFLKQLPELCTTESCKFNWIILKRKFSIGQQQTRGQYTIWYLLGVQWKLIATT